MKLTTTLLAALAASSTSAYRIDLWSDYNYQDTQRTFTSAGTHTLGFAAKSWIWNSPLADGCCIVFCRSGTNVGKYCGSASKSQSSAGTNKVVIGCNGATLNC